MRSLFKFEFIVLARVETMATEKVDSLDPKGSKAKSQLVGLGKLQQPADVIVLKFLYTMCYQTC